MWNHYAIRCDKCGQLGLGFDGSPIVYYNAGRLARGNFTQCYPGLIRCAETDHICQCGNKVRAHTISFVDYKAISKSNKDIKRLYESAVDKYKILALENKLRDEIRALKIANSPATVSIKHGEVIAHGKRIVGTVKYCLENGLKVKLVRGKIYAQLSPHSEQFHKFDI